MSIHIYILCRNTSSYVGILHPKMFSSHQLMTDPCMSAATLNIRRTRNQKEERGLRPYQDETSDWENILDILSQTACLPCIIDQVTRSACAYAIEYR